MKIFSTTLLLLLGLCIACSKPGILTPAEFTRQYVQALHRKSPDLKIEIVHDLAVKVTFPDGKDSTTYLDNAYALYKQDSSQKDAVIQRYVASDIETLAHFNDHLDKTKIIPIIKDRAWLAEIKQSLLAEGAKEIPERVYEDYNSELVIVYAEDSASNISYFDNKNFEKLEIDRKELRSMAVENLRKLLPKIEKHGANGVYLVTAGGDYDACLILFDSLWDKGQFDVRGDIVVTIPARDVLLVTGSDDAEGIKKVKSMAEEASSGPYRLTKKLFVYRQGKFEVFDQ